MSRAKRQKSIKIIHYGRIISPYGRGFFKTNEVLLLMCLPLCLDCFDLSKAAVDSRVDKVFTSDVLPESTCPKIPTLTLITSSVFGVFFCADAVVDAVSPLRSVEVAFIILFWGDT